MDKAILDDQANGLFFHIDRITVIMDTYHVQMSLQHECGGRTVSGGGRLFDDHIVCFILSDLKSQRAGYSYAVITDCLYIIGSAGNPADLFKIIENSFRL
jgi:hypothetical protein